MEFDCKLAHCDEIKKVSGFNSIKELYVKITQTFQPMETSDILYCTLNTHNFRDMNSLLANYLSFGDLIIVHLCGSVRNLTIKKSSEFLGLTITDNSIGRSFVKRIKSEDKHIEENIRPGDHIAAINAESTIGLRHYEVAKSIRLLPQNTNFTMSLIEPKYDEKYLKADMEMRRSDNAHTISSNRLELSGAINLAALTDDLINSSLPMDRLLSKSTQKINGRGFNSPNNEDGYKATIDKINTSLESFLGISDNLLAIKIYRLARENKDSFKAFSGAIRESDLEVFNFDDEMKDYLWKCATELTVR